MKFRWRGSLYQFRSCPFGLASAPRSFTKLLKPAMALLRCSGIQAIIYLDDIILINASQEMLRAHTETTRWLLEHLGFVVNYDKSQLEPVRQIEYLGFILDTVAMLAHLPPGKEQNIRQKCMEMLSNTHVTVRVLAKLLGKLTSTVRAILPGPLHYRQLQMQKTKVLLWGEGSELWSSCGANQGVHGRTCLVDRHPGKLEWSHYDKGQPRPGDADKNRCLKKRLGCSVPRHEYSGTLVRPGETGAHQPIGVESSILCRKDIHQGHDKHPSAP